MREVIISFLIGAAAALIIQNFVSHVGREIRHWKADRRLE